MAVASEPLEGHDPDPRELAHQLRLTADALDADVQALRRYADAIERGALTGLSTDG